MSEVSRNGNDRFVGALANIVLIAALMPYISPVPVRGMDVQLTALVVAVLAILCMLVVVPRRLTVFRKDLLICSLGLLVLFYVDFSRVAMGMAWLRACGTLLLGFPVYFAVRNLYWYMSARVFVAVVGIYAGVLMFQLAFPRLYLATFSKVLPEVRWDPGGPRGPNGLCVEPSMLGNMCIVFAISLYFFHRDYWRQHHWGAAFVFIASALMLVISQSATGFVLAFLALLLALFASRCSRKLKVVCISGFMLLLAIGGTLLESGGGRGAQFVSSAVKNPAVIVQDPSFAMRFVGVFLGCHGLQYAPLGTGELVLNQKLADNAWEGDFMRSLWPDPDLRQYARDWTAYLITSNNASGIGPVIQRMGVVGLLSLSLLLCSVGGFRGKWVVRAVLAGLLLNTSLFISTIWFVIGCCIAGECAINNEQYCASAGDGGRA